MGIPEPEHGGEAIAWEHPTSQMELEALLTSDSPIMIDVYADWCIPCKEMDKLTFPDGEIVKLSKKFTAIKIDMTKDSGDFEKYFQQEYSIKGVPSYIFMNNGHELTSLRSTGYENVADFLKRMQGAL